MPQLGAAIRTIAHESNSMQKTPSKLYASGILLVILIITVVFGASVRSDDPATLPNLKSAVVELKYPSSFRNLGEIVRFGRGGSTEFVPVDPSREAEAIARAEATAREWLSTHCPTDWGAHLKVSKIEVSETGAGIYFLTFVPEYEGIPIEQKNWVEVNQDKITYAYLQPNEFARFSEESPKVISRSDAYRELSSHARPKAKAVKYSEDDLRLIYRQSGVLVDGKPRLQFSPVWIAPEDIVYVNAHTGECAIND